MVITIYYSEFKAQGGAAGETAHCLVSDEDYLGLGHRKERGGSWKVGSGVWEGGVTRLNF